jgi:hypothetical protein
MILESFSLKLVFIHKFNFDEQSHYQYQLNMFHLRRHFLKAKQFS